MLSPLNILGKLWLTNLILFEYSFQIYEAQKKFLKKEIHVIFCFIFENSPNWSFLSPPSLQFPLTLLTTISMAAASLSATFSALSLNPHRHTHPLFSSHHLPFSAYKTPLSLVSKAPPLRASSADFEIPFLEGEGGEETGAFSPPERPEGFVPPPSFDDGPVETEEEIARAFEELYGAAYSGESFLGNDVYAMDAKVKKATGFGSKTKKEKVRDGFDERVVQVRRVTKVVKGGKQLHFRAVVVVGDKQGNVGVGVGKAKEVVAAVQKSAVNARRNIVAVPMTKYKTFPHRSVCVSYLFVQSNLCCLVFLILYGFAMCCVSG